jgi:hypothetical protein
MFYQRSFKKHFFCANSGFAMIYWDEDANLRSIYNIKAQTNKFSGIIFKSNLAPEDETNIYSSKGTQFCSDSKWISTNEFYFYCKVQFLK